MTLKAIETSYNGYRFRSRLEARWAVFFDALGIVYEYEKECFELPFRNFGLIRDFDSRGIEVPWELEFVPPDCQLDELPRTICYLPDFWIPTWRAWVEIKPSEPETDDFIRAHLLDSQTNDRVFLFAGNPWPECYKIACFYPASQRGDVQICWYDQITQCRRCDGLCLLASNGGGWGEIGRHTCGDNERWPPEYDGSQLALRRAYAAARSARFDPKGKTA